MISAESALARLREGNDRYVAGNRATLEFDFKAHAGGQQPFAIVLGCSDSRVPAEMVFDQGLGDLFVVRVAGNIVAPSQIGSIEFAATQFGAKLVVVLGHSACGAVQATIDQLGQPEGERSPNLAAIVDRIEPAISHVVEASDGGDLVKACCEANVRFSAGQLEAHSDILDHAIRTGDLTVVGAYYDLETGKVTFLDE